MKKLPAITSAISMPFSVHFGDEPKPPVVNPLAFLQGEEAEEDEIEKDELETPPEKKDPPPPPDKKKGADDNAKALRQAKEKAEKERDELKKKVEEFEAEFKPLTPIKEYLKTKEGKIDDEVVNKYITKNKDRKEQVKRLTDLEQTLQEKEKTVQELEITKSETWQKEYVQPMAKAAKHLFATLVNIDDEGKPKYPKLVESFLMRIAKINERGEPLDHLEIKAELKKFAKEFEDKTGIEYEMPKLSEVVEGVNSYVNKVISAETAKQNWSKEVQEKQKSQIFEQAEKEKALVERELKVRDHYFNKVINSDEFKELKELLGDDPAEIAKEEHENLAKVVRRERPKDRNYPEVITLMTKGQLFDKLLAKYKETEEKLQKVTEERDSGLGAGSGKPKPKPRRSDDDEEEEKVTKKEDYDPLSFIRKD